MVCKIKGIADRDFLKIFIIIVINLVRNGMMSLLLKGKTGKVLTIKG